MGNLALLTEATFLVLAIIFSLFVFIPLSYTLNEFQKSGSGCLLFAAGKWNDSGSSERPTFKVTHYGRLSMCNLNIVTGVVVLLWSALYLLNTLVHLIRGTHWWWMSALLVLFVNALLFVFSVACALIVTLGFQKWCHQIVDGKHTRRCRDVVIRWKHGSEDRSDFYIQYTLAIIGMWSIVLSYLVLLLTSWRRICLYHKRESITRSLHRERRRLVHSIQSFTNYSSLSSRLQV